MMPTELFVSEPTADRRFAMHGGFYSLTPGTAAWMLRESDNHRRRIMGDERAQAAATADAITAAHLSLDPAWEWARETESIYPMGLMAEYLSVLRGALD